MLREEATLQSPRLLFIFRLRRLILELAPSYNHVSNGAYEYGNFPCSCSFGCCLFGRILVPSPLLAVGLSPLLSSFSLASTLTYSLLDHLAGLQGLRQYVL